MSFGNLEHWFINMKILIFSALYLLVQTSRIFAQSDSLAVSKANWIKEKSILLHEKAKIETL
jgi:hypothetical protein